MYANCRAPATTEIRNAVKVSTRVDRIGRFQMHGRRSRMCYRYPIFRSDVIKTLSPANGVTARGACRKKHFPFLPKAR